MAKANGETKEESTEVKTQETAVSETIDYGEDAGAGIQDTKGSELSIPFISILQANSPQVNGNDPEGSRPGMLFNTVTRELYDGEKEGVIFQPCHKAGPLWVEWVPRGKGGGFLRTHLPESEAVKEGKPIMHPETGKPTRKLRHGENELIETFYLYGLTLEEDGKVPDGFAVISFTSTKIKPYRGLVTTMYTLKHKPPIFANRARITTAKEIKDNNAYFNFRIDPLWDTWASSLINPNTEKGLLEEAKRFRDLIQSGVARAAFESTTSEAGEGADPDKPPF